MDTQQFHHLEEVSGWCHLPTDFLRREIRKGHLKAYFFDRYYITLNDFNVYVNNGFKKFSNRGRKKKS